MDDLTSVSGNSLANGYVGLDSIITLDMVGEPVTGISAALTIDNFLGDSELILEAYDSDMALLDSRSVAELASDSDWSNVISLYYPSPVSRFTFYDELGQNFWIDNVESEVIPEPATILLLGLGLGGVAVSRRRVRRKQA